MYLPVGACDRGGCGLGDALCRCMVYDGVDRRPIIYQRVLYHQIHDSKVTEPFPKLSLQPAYKTGSPPYTTIHTLASSMSNSSLPQAFRIVRQLLAERPRAFQEILRDGLPTTSTSTSSSASSQTSSTSNGKSSSKGKGKLVAGASHVPADHPFVSAK